LVFNLVANGEATTNNNAVSGNMENQCDESSSSSDIISCMEPGTPHQSKENDTTERCSGLCLTSDVHPHNVSININNYHSVQNRQLAYTLHRMRYAVEQPSEDYLCREI